MDELGLFNVAYMFAREGSLSFPAQLQYDRLSVHPPTHYLEVGSALRAGLSPYYAEALPAFLVLVLALSVICASAFPDGHKLALLFGVFGTWVVHGIARSDLEIVHFGFGMRPELHMSLAWFAGLVALENGRLRGWSPRWLFLGSALLTYGSTIHYPASFAWVGVLVHVAWALKARGARAGAPILAALLGGALLVGLPYLFLWVIPGWNGIVHAVRSHGEGGAIGSLTDSVSMHRSVYEHHYGIFGEGALGVALLPLRLGLPVVLLTTPALLVSRWTRGLALASLPYPLFLLLFTVWKSEHRGYFMPELSLYFSVLVIGAVGASGRSARARSRVVVAASAVLCALVLASPIVRRAELPPSRRMVESSVARWAAKKMLGPDARVASRMSFWYCTGAAHYRHIVPDIFATKVPEKEIDDYLSSLDAVAEGPWRTYHTTSRGESVPSWYGSGFLELRGFYFSARSTQLSYVLLSRRSRSAPLRGFARLADREVVSFEEDPSGDHVFVAAMGDASTLKDSVPDAVFGAFYALRRGPEGEHRDLVTLLAPAAAYEKARAEVAGGASIRDEIRGRLLRLGRDVDVVDLGDDQPIEFLRPIRR
ncbi:hypothetical protein HY251_21460 [bacterium]|nr:hypothetical protein [bacterium]